MFYRLVAYTSSKVRRNAAKLIPVLIGLAVICAQPALAKASKKEKTPPGLAGQTDQFTVDVDFLSAVFGIGRETVLHYEGFGLSAGELSLVLYCYSVSGQSFSDPQISFIARQRNWTELSWYCGLPPILLEDGFLVLRRPWRDRLYPPLGQAKYQKERKGKGGYEEKLAINPGKYDYKYEDKRLGVEERLMVTRTKYEYRYSDRNMEETLTVHLKTMRYDYKFEDRRTGSDIKRSGIGRPLTPDNIYEALSREHRTDPGFHLSIRLEIGF